MERAARSPYAIYLEHLERGELAYQYSTAARRAVFHPRLVCPVTGSSELEWRVSSGLGTVHATTVNHPPKATPYNVALVEMDEGFRLMSRVEDIAPEEVHIGMRVRFRTARQEPDADPLPVFTPAEPSP